MLNDIGKHEREWFPGTGSSYPNGTPGQWRQEADGTALTNFYRRSQQKFQVLSLNGAPRQKNLNKTPEAQSNDDIRPQVCWIQMFPSIREGQAGPRTALLCLMWTCEGQAVETDSSRENRCCPDRYLHSATVAHPPVRADQLRERGVWAVRVNQ